MLGSCAQPTRVGSCLFAPVTNHEGQSLDGVVSELHLSLESKDTVVSRNRIRMGQSGECPYRSDTNCQPPCAPADVHACATIYIHVEQL